MARRITRTRNGIKSSFISDLENRERARMDMYIKAREYYDGIHNTQLTDRLKKFLHLDTLSNADDNTNRDYNANYMPMVVNAKADRLKVIGFDVPDDKAQKEVLTGWWRKNRMDKKSGIVHRASIRDADSFVLCEWDTEADMPRFHYEPAFAGSGVMVYYSEERRDEIEFASKHWQIKHGHGTGVISRLNLYFPNRIEKYIASGENSRGWMPYDDDSTDTVGDGALGEAGITWWTASRTPEGEPLGIPIVHFPNNDNGDGFGTSHIADVMPIQDAVNKAMIDLLAVMDANGVPIYAGYGTESWNTLEIGPGAIAAVSKSPNEAKLEMIAGVDPKGLLNVYQALVMEIGRISGTPLSYFQSSGQVAAEGTMKQQEVALITQVEKAQTDYGNSWEDVMNMGRRLHNAFSASGLQLETDAIIDTLWKQAESRNEKEQAETLLVKKELGVSEAQAQTEMGYNETQRAAFRRDNLRNTALAIRRPPIIQTAENQDESANLTQTENEGEQVDGAS